MTNHLVISLDVFFYIIFVLPMYKQRQALKIIYTLIFAAVIRFFLLAWSEYSILKIFQIEFVSSCLIVLSAAFHSFILDKLGVEDILGNRKL